MRETRQSNLGGPLFVAGAVIMVVGLLGFFAPGGADWTSTFVGFVGAVMSSAGLYLVSRRNGTRGTRHSTP